MFALVDGMKTPPAQVAQCQDHLGHKYRSGMKQPTAGSTRARSTLRCVVVVFLCGGGDCMWWWLYVVVVAALGGDCHLCVAVVVLLYDCICAWWLWSIMNEDAT